MDRNQEGLIAWEFTKEEPDIARLGRIKISNELMGI